jgi:hypothetical protein
LAPLKINGTSVVTSLLTDKFNDVGQPIPEFIDCTDYLNTRYQGNLTGYTTIMAHDMAECSGEILEGFPWNKLNVYFVIISFIEILFLFILVV